MHEIQRQLKRFLAREIGLEELQRRFALMLEDESDLASKAAAWLDAGEQDGRISSAVCTSLKNVIVAHLAASADGPDPRNSGIFDEIDFAPLGVTVMPRRSTTQDGSEPEATFVRSTEATRVGSSGRDDDTSKDEQTAEGIESVLQIGSLIGKRYELVAELGSGGMGHVFKARDRLRAEAQDRDPFLALKVLSEKFKAHPDSMIALQREARRAQSLAHPNVITVHEFFRDGPHYYMTMELLHGAPLDQIIRSEFSGGISIEEAWPIIEGAGLALQYGHEKGIVHADIKPGNIFRCDDGTIKVLDFGISRPMPVVNGTESQQTVFDPGTRLGSLTPAYASLEMWHQDAPDPRDDIYALSCVIYLLLTGRHPFDGKSAKEAFQENLEPARIDSLSRSQWAALARGLSLRRDARIKSVSKLLAILTPQAVIRSRRRMALLVSALVVAILVAIGVRYYGVWVEEGALAGQTMNGEGYSLPNIDKVELTPDEIDALLGLARLELDAVDRTGDANQLASVLSQGPNNVLQSLEMVLNIDSGNDVARQMRNEIFEIYFNRASQLRDSRDYESALMMAQAAGAITMNRSVRRFVNDICGIADPPANCP